MARAKPQSAKDRGLRWGEGSVTERAQTDSPSRWQARWPEQQPDGSVKHRAETFDTLDEAEDHLRKMSRDKRDGRYVAPSAMTVADLITEHLDRASDRLTARTVRTYRDRADTMILPYLGTKRVSHASTLDLQRWIDGLSRAGFQPRTVHSAVAVLTGAFREAATLGIIDRNTADGIRRPTIKNVDIQTWTETEARYVLRSVKDDPIFGALYHLAIAIGPRPGELRALSWDHVDLEAGRVTICRTITRNKEKSEVIINRTKSGKPRTIALAPETVAILRRHRTGQTERRLAANEWQDLRLVFDRGDGHWIYQSGWWRFHQDICGKLGIKAIRHHDLRHTFATLMLERNVHPKIVSEILGHASIEMTLNLYSHVSVEMQEAALHALGAALVADTDDEGKHNDGVNA